MDEEQEAKEITPDLFLVDLYCGCSIFITGNELDEMFPPQKVIASSSQQLKCPKHGTMEEMVDINKWENVTGTIGQT